MDIAPRPLQAARTRLSILRPYVATALWNLHLVETTRLPTMAVDQYWRLYYNPKFVEKISVEELAAVLYHEVWHLLRAHNVRAKNYDSYLTVPYGKWGQASDLEINDDIVDVEHLPLPDGCLLPRLMTPKAMPNGKTAEEYMTLLPEPEVITIQVGTGGKGKKDNDEVPANGNCGSGADGQKRDYESGTPSQANPGIQQAEAEIIRLDVAQKIVEHASKMAGTMAGNALRWAKKLIKPEVDWRRELNAVLRSSVAEARGFTDFSFRRPSRRQPFPDIKLPSMVSPVPKVAIQTDTSGSVSDKMLGIGLAEVDGILKAIGLKDTVTHFSVDMAVGGVKKISRASQIEFEGGGGTDMGVGIEFAKTLRPKIDILVVLTDGYTPWPETAPAFRTVVVLLADGSSPDWAKTIRINKTSDDM